MVGQTLAHYRVLEKIGQGGMGEVYLAEDTNLNRQVAIKVLPEQLATDTESLARFEREAQLLASLNHPNIATIHGLEESDGKRFIAMELVEGETLAERLTRGPLPVEEALKTAKQIAEGLETAHEKGVIHRDLKPANIKITPVGQAKILDFGLAKAFEAEGTPADATHSPTLTDAMTRAGVILGTAAYMSPEQAKGQETDRRADIFAFGAVLYEMLTAQRAFPGETITETLAKILEGEPNWTQLPPSVPVKIRDLIRRCLNKDIGRRQQHIDDARIEIEEALATPASQLSTATPALPPSSRWRLTISLAVAGIAIAGIAGFVGWSMVPEAERSVIRSAINVPPTERLGAGAGLGYIVPLIALSPDGQTLAYCANGQLYLRKMNAFESSSLAGTEGAAWPFFSPDSQWVGFFADGKLKKISINGGAPLTLCDSPGIPEGASWGVDETIVFAQSRSGLLAVPAAGGAPRELTTVDAEAGERAQLFPHYLPGGKAILFVQESNVGLENRRIAVHSVESGETKILLSGTQVQYLSTGHLIYTQAENLGTLVAIPFDASRLEVTGPPVPVLEGVTFTGGGLGQFSTSDNGTLVYVPGTSLGQLGRILVWVDRQGNDEPLGAPPASYSIPRLSPDGQRLSLYRTDQPHVWIWDLSRRTLTRLTFEGDNRLPVWSPDGTKIAFRSDRAGGPWNLYWKAADGSGAVERLTESQNDQTPSSWSPDGKVLAFYQRSAGQAASTTEGDIWTLALEGAAEPEPFLQTPFYESSAVFSPDGSFLAYVSNESGRNEIYVQPYPGPGAKLQISTEGGVEPAWARSGELFYRSEDGIQMMVVQMSTRPTLRASNPELLFEGRFDRSTGTAAQYDVTTDGQRFVMLRSAALGQFHVVLNWFEELKQRLPID